MQPISLQVPVPDGAWHASTLVRFSEELELVATIPSDVDPALLSPGARVMVELPSPDGLRRFAVQVRNRSDAPPAVRLTWPDEGERIQRREFVRVPVEWRVDVKVPPAEPDGATTTLVGRTVDLSAGGMRINLPSPVAPETEVELELRVPREEEPTRFQGRVLRTAALPRPMGPNLHWIAVAFTEMSGNQQREVTKLVFDIQRDLLRRV